MFGDFDLATAETTFGLTTVLGVLFGALTPASVPTWLNDQLERGRQAAALGSEKARSEFLVVPVLLALCEFAPDSLTIYSGQRLDVDPDRGLIGECDYIIARTPPIPRLRSPLLIVLEAKKSDIEAGLGQCVAQMLGAQLFNARAGEPPSAIFGCVTTGEVWQLLRLHASEVTIDTTRLYIDHVGAILAAFRAIIANR